MTNDYNDYKKRDGKFGRVDLIDQGDRSRDLAEACIMDLSP